MVEQSTQGSFHPHGRQDILAVAIGTPEHPGRVRAAGRGVGIRQYFGAPSVATHTLRHLNELEFESLKQKIRKEIRDEVYSDLKAELLSSMRAELASLSSQPSVPARAASPIHVSTKESCDAPDRGAEVAPTDIAECELYVAGPPEHLVAYGTYYIFDMYLVHC